MNELCSGVNGFGHVTASGVQHRAADNESSHTGQRERVGPLLDEFVFVVTRVSAEQECRKRRRRHDAFHLGDNGQFEPRVGARVSEPRRDGDRENDLIGREVVGD